MLDERPAGTTTVDALREFLLHEAPDEAASSRKKSHHRQPRAPDEDARAPCRLEPMLAESIARDLGTEPRRHPPAPDRGLDDRRLHVRPRPLLRGGVRRRAVTHEQGMAILDEVLEFLRGGLEALQHD